MARRHCYETRFSAEMQPLEIVWTAAETATIPGERIALSGWGGALSYRRRKGPVSRRARPRMDTLQQFFLPDRSACAFGLS